MKPLKPPSDLKAAGRALWDQLNADYDLTGVEYLAAELCRTHDRLTEIRARMAKVTGPEYVRWIGSEAKAMASAARLWRLLGIPSAETPERG